MARYEKKIALLLPILVLAAVLRFHGLNWDQNNHLHPDERFLTMVATDAKVPESVGQYLNPDISPLNPYNMRFSFFVYGTLPLTLNKLFVQPFSADNYAELTLYGRFLSACFDLATLLTLFALFSLWEREYKLDEWLKYLTAFFYAIAVLPIQQSHFFTVDSFVTFFMISSFYWAFRAYVHGAVSSVAASGGLLGAALACKISAIYIVPLALLFAVFEPNLQLTVRYVVKHLRVRFLRLIVFVLSAYVALRLGDPRVFESANFLNPAISPQFIGNIEELTAQNTLDTYFPPAVQWIGKANVTFALKNIAFFGLGVPYFLLVLLGMGSFLQQRRVELIVLFLWILGFYLYQSSQATKTLRYFYCLYPFFAGFAAFGVLWLTRLFQPGASRGVVCLVVLALAALWPLAFVSIYSKPHTRIQASKWMYENLAEGSVLAQEHWDDGLPLRLPGENKQYQVVQMPVFDPDTTEKWNTMNDILGDADYIVLTSNRGYGSIGAVPDRYPRMSRFYTDLFSGSRAFKKVYEVTSNPQVQIGYFRVEFADQWADEAFTVYDHPKVMIFKRI